MLIYIRHSDDDYSDPTYQYDTTLTKNGKKLAYKIGKKIIAKYDMPNIIYCSPFRRTRKTLKYMLKNFTPEQLNTIQIIFVSDLSRYFTSKEKQISEVSQSTLKVEIPIYETREEFHQRVEECITNYEPYIASSKIIWCITHAVVYKRIASHYNIKIPDYIPFMHYFICQNHYENHSHSHSHSHHSHSKRSHKH